MAKAYIKELERLPNQNLPVWHEPPVAWQKPVDFNSGAASSQPFSDITHYIVVITDTDCSYLVGDPGVVATQDNFLLPANDRLILGVDPGRAISFVKKNQGGGPSAEAPAPAHAKHK